MSSSQVHLVELPIPSTTLTSKVHLHDDGGDLTLSYEYHQDEGLRRRRRLGSEWREDLEAVSLEHGFSYGKLHHFMIYIDSMGCYEVLARGWRFLRHR